jgi:transcriptional regulator with XRE-family HTH domain
MTRQQRRRQPRDDDEAAAFRGMGQAVAAIRERHGMRKDDLASKAEMTVPELEAIERGELDEWWGGLRLIAKAFDLPLSELVIEADAFASGEADG